MNHIHVRPIIFAGFLFLIFPLIGIEAPCINAKNDPGSSLTDSRRGRIAPRDMLRFLSANINRLIQSEVDKGILQLITLQEECLKRYQSDLFSEDINPKINNYSLEDLTRLRNIKEENIKDLVRNILADGLILSSSEGMIYAEIDYPAISVRFGRYSTKSVNGYLRIMARETVQHFAEDAALMISPEILSRRIAAVDTYLRENRSFARRNEIRELGQKYLSAYLIGMNNTPAFNYQTDRLESRFYKSYQNTITKYPGTQFAGIVKEYLNLLRKNDFQKTKAVLDFANHAPSIFSK